MVKTAQKGSKTKKAQPAQRGARAARRPSGQAQGAGRRGGNSVTAYRPAIDQTAAKWLRLLADPCGADLTSPCYGGSGSGYFARQVQTLVPPANAVDYMFEFTPSGDNLTIFRYGYSTTPGGALGTATTMPLYGLVSGLSVGRRRCIAACVKVQYLGTELERSGLVSSVVLPGAELIGGETITGASTDWSNSMNHTCRLGEPYEYRWAPGEGDQEWLANTFGDTKGTNSTLGNSLQILLRGIPPGKVELHLTSCWEWVPAQEGAGIPWAPGAARAPPPVPFQTVMSVMGDLAKWTARNMAVAGSNMISTTATAALRAATPALMLL